MEGPSNTGTVVGVLMRILAIYEAVTYVIAGCTSIALSLTPSDTTTSAYFGLVG